ncbi:MAG: RagB/SusD family nutrient uptake outer membrane protein [Bacteroidales bacterium]|nr:RagB/SusD family nutrient uptake outer membrane protein [Bacteroidales bacterium]
MLNELTEAAELLPETRTDGTYRANKWAALGLKSRVALYAASVSRYWKNAVVPACEPVTLKLTYMEESYAKDYYTQCIEASEAIINSGVFSLYNPNPSSVGNAVTALTELFQSRQDCEFIFGKSYNNGVATSTNNFDVPNSPMQVKRTGQVWKWGCYSVGSDIVDLYDNYDADFGRVDGTVKTRVDGNETSWFPTVYTDATNASKVDYIAYDQPEDAFADKDARFQAWVIYPGVNFRSVDIVIQGGLWNDAKGLQICGGASDYVTAGGQKYFMYGAESSDNYSGFDGRGRTNDGSWYTTGFGIRKFLNPDEAVQYSTNPWYDIRYTEILLNYCEAVVERDGAGAGKSNDYLNAIRRRAYFQDNIVADLDNVLKERRLELAFEEDRSMTMHRRREYYRIGIDKDESAARRHALIPVCDVRSGKAQYIFVRANMFADDLDKMPSVPVVNAENYYNPIRSYTTDKIVANPSQLL